MNYKKNRSKYTQDALTRCAKSMIENPKDRTKSKAQPRPGYKKRKKK